MRSTPDEPERRCILSGEHGTRDGLIRLALGPDNSIAPDLGARAGGRGAWLGVDRAALETAHTKGKLKGALARAFKDGTVGVPDDLGERIATGLQKRAFDRIGLENRAGHLILGSERIGEALGAGAATLLLVSADAGTDARQGLSAKARNNEAAVLHLPTGREALSVALGRSNSVFVAVGDAPAAERVAADIRRWRAFLGLSPDGDDAPDTPSSPGDSGGE
jgi:predicted RNA-binding protein YlxR (DUF448 family)/ribosomal protein L30E